MNTYHLENTYGISLEKLGKNRIPEQSREIF